MKERTKSFYEAAVQRAVERIVRQLDQALELAALSREAALSPLHFHRVFRGMIGETPLELQRRLRLERAAFQLSTTDLAVTHIAFDAGYETHEAFTRAFRRAYGVPPSAFRLGPERSSGCAGPFQIELAALCGVHFCAAETSEVTLRFIKGEAVMQVELKEMPDLRLAAVRHIGPYNRISQAFEKLGAIVGPSGLIRECQAMMAVYHDDPETTPQDQLRSDAALVVPNDIKLPDGLSEIRIAGGRYACTTHVGPYTQLGDVWGRLMGEWLPSSGHRVGPGVSFEIYRNTPATVSEAELRTELYVPIE